MARTPDVTVTPYPDGPLVVRGPVVVYEEGTGRVLPARASTALCRCGLSGRAPICDGSHKQARGERQRRPAPAPDD
jgi:CDGSH-type Zn-finger protein